MMEAKIALIELMKKISFVRSADTEVTSQHNHKNMYYYFDFCAGSIENNTWVYHVTN